MGYRELSRMEDGRSRFVRWQMGESQPARSHVAQLVWAPRDGEEVPARR